MLNSARETYKRSHSRSQNTLLLNICSNTLTKVIASRNKYLNHHKDWDECSDIQSANYDRKRFDLLLGGGRVHWLIWCEWWDDFEAMPTLNRDVNFACTRKQCQECLGGTHENCPLEQLLMKPRDELSMILKISRGEVALRWSCWEFQLNWKKWTSEKLTHVLNEKATKVYWLLKSERNILRVRETRESRVALAGRENLFSSFMNRMKGVTQYLHSLSFTASGVSVLIFVCWLVQSEGCKFSVAVLLANRHTNKGKGKIHAQAGSCPGAILGTVLWFEVPAKLNYTESDQLRLWMMLSDFSWINNFAKCIWVEKVSFLPQETSSWQSYHGNLEPRSASLNEIISIHRLIPSSIFPSSLRS